MKKKNIIISIVFVVVILVGLLTYEALAMENCSLDNEIFAPEESITLPTEEVNKTKIEDINSKKVLPSTEPKEEPIIVYTVEELIILIEQQDKMMADMHEIAEIARGQNLPENHKIIVGASEQWWVAHHNKDNYQKQLNELIPQEHFDEYPAAATAWYFLKEQGYSDAVCAGILGNMMAECGGQTLNLQWDIYGSGGWYYGICQWHKGYFPEVQGQDLNFQLQYLIDTMEDQFDDFGSNNLSNFLAITDPGYAAREFNRCYERGAGSSVRERCAWVAYNYFVSN